MHSLCLYSQEPEALVSICIGDLNMLIYTYISCNPPETMSLMLLMSRSYKLYHVLTFLVCFGLSPTLPLVIAGTTYAHHLTDILDIVFFRQ